MNNLKPGNLYSITFRNPIKFKVDYNTYKYGPYPEHLDFFYIVDEDKAINHRGALRIISLKDNYIASSHLVESWNADISLEYYISLAKRGYKSHVFKIQLNDILNGN